jgi:hypothetical protein
MSMRRKSEWLINIHTRVAFGVAFVDVLEQGRTFLAIKLRAIFSRQPRVEHVFNGEFKL